MKTQPAISKEGLTVGLALALVSGLTTSVGSFLVLRTMEAENRAYVQQSIGDTTLILSAYFKTEFEHYKDSVLEAGDRQIRPLIASFMIHSPSGTSAPRVGTVDTDPEISDISVWRRGKSGSIFDLNPDPVRAFLAVNSQNSKYSAEFVRHLETNGLQEKDLILPAFQGQMIVTLPPPSLGLKHEALVAIPFGHGVVDEVLVAHVNLVKLHQAFSRGGMVFSILVDDLGNVIAHPDPSRIGYRDGVSRTPLFQAMKSSQLPSSQLIYQDVEGNEYFGGFTRLSLGRLAVLASLSEEEATAAIRVMKKQMLIYIAAGFLFFLGTGYLVATRGTFSKMEKRKAGSQELENQPAKKMLVTVVYGSLRHVHKMIDEMQPEDLAAAINDYLSVAASTVKEFGGIFERQSSTSFVGMWGLPEADGTEVWRALRCTLELRQNFFHLNESRRVDGHKPLVAVMGVHTGIGLAARTGTFSQMKYTVMGDVLNCAKSLSRLTNSLGVDFLVSQDTWQQSEAKFDGEPKGEAKLSATTGLTAFYFLSGYRDEQGQLVSVEMPKELYDDPKEVLSESTSSALITQEKKVGRWLVNNGTQIVGPLTPHEIASRLFAQELDFDCECWAEGTGNSAQIKNAGIFTGSDDDHANLWVFDGEMVHGPMNIGFLKTAMGHGAIQGNVYVCSESTVQGWKPLSEWADSYLEQNPPSDNSLRAYLAPPISALNEANLKATPSPDLLESSDEEHPQKKVA